jgi:diguanylate cyclase (GGDEF)-like protein
VESPATPLRWDGITDRAGELMVLVLPSAVGGPLRLRGQFVVDAPSGTGFFLGSVWVEGAEQLVAAGLTLDDFAAHDAVLDRLFSAQADQLAREDAARLDSLLAAAEHTREQLLAAEQALARELDAVPDLLLRLASDGTVLTVRASASTELNLPAAEHVGRDVFTTFPAMAEGLRAALAEDDDRPCATFEFAEERNGSLRHFEARVARTSAGDLLLLIRDVTEQRVLAGRLQEQASCDALTGLPNRSVFTARVALALAAPEPASGARACVLFVDLDDFKQVNDVLGHAAGDALLVDAAERMQQCLRPDDVLARLGGDEFAVLLVGAGLTEGQAAAGRLRESLSQPFPATAERPAVVTGASIGVAAAVSTDTERSLLSHADVAMYAAKAGGKGCYRVFEEGMRDRLLARISAEMDLRGALERDQLFLQYQPVVHAGTGEVVGAEALVRWNHPVRGLIPPNDFIPVAEASGLIVPLGSWVLHEACRSAVTWPGDEGRPPPGISVNVSARQLVHGDLAADVRRALTSSGLAPHRLTLEVTETALGATGDAVLDCLTAVRALGVRISLDDFGTGYSSLTHLRRFPIDEIKIDRSFVSELGDPRQARIAEGVLALAAVLEVEVVAEGVERSEQASALKSIGCTLMQGWLYGRPGTDEQLRHPAADVLEMVSRSA